MTGHDFHKQNLVTTPKGDLYECTVCKASGYRMGFTERILLSDKMAVKAEQCSTETFEKISVADNLTKMASRPKTSLRPKLVLTKKLPVGAGGVEEGLHKVVECPTEYQDRFATDVWVMSKGTETDKSEPVRVLSHEIIDREF